MKIGVLANPKFRNIDELCSEIFEAIGEGVEIVVESSLASTLGIEGVELAEMDVEILITLGGDGTILYALQRSDAIIAGINAGQLGFLTEIPKDQVSDMVRRIVTGDYAVEERIKLMVELDGERLPDCMNEVVLHTSQVSKMRHFELLVDSIPALNIRSDGLIVATPTGSTSYAMSVGGPLIDPRVDAFVAAPIAPFNLGVRPLVIPASSRIEIRLIKPRDCVMVLDGQQEYAIDAGSALTLGRSERAGRFIRFEKDFYSRAWEKLRM